METTHCSMNIDGTDFRDFNTGCLCGKHASETQYDAFFAKTHVFLSQEIISRIEKSITVLEKVITSVAFMKRVFAEAYTEIQAVPPQGGVIMSYDFHVDGDTPKLIEINTNAGGVFLNYELLKASKECCKETEMQDISHFEETIVSMFKEEFVKKSSKTLETILIVDEHPREQFLYPEFLLCKEILEKHGLQVFIADPEEVSVKDGFLYIGDVKIDLVYNRLTDFYFEKEEYTKLAEAQQKGSVVITPNSNDHKLFANKMNYLLLQDRDLLGTILNDEELTVMKECIPETVIVDASTSEALWANRKKYFFKPYSGFGGRGAYNGRGLTKETWRHINEGGYLAQEIVSANARVMKRDEGEEVYKFDIRAYVYRGKVILFAARMYQGQTTNFRTKGGGFAPILITTR